jgi:hypothetical protein
MEETMNIWKAALCVALAVPFVGAVRAAEPDGVSVQKGAFAITVPPTYGPFVKQVQKTGSPDGEIETTNWVSKAPTGEALIVTMSRMPAKILDPQKLFATARASLLKTLAATLESETPRPGDAGSVRLLFHSDLAFFRARFTVEGDRFYELLYVGRSADQRSAPAVGHLFDSFQIQSSAPPATPPV